VPPLRHAAEARGKEHEGRRTREGGRGKEEEASGKKGSGERKRDSEK
jgi:hypothetical protein